LVALNRDLGVPTPEAFGIDPTTWEARLPLMAEQALASGSPQNNPRVPSAAEILSLYREVWSSGRNAP
jgi:alcohol dehydrogenase class IV